MIGEKRCRTCKTSKPTSVFGVRRRNADGLSDQCKDCRNDAARRWSQSERGGELKRQANRKWFKSHREQVRISSRTIGRYAHVKAMAKNKGAQLTIPKAEYLALVAQPCTYCGGDLPTYGVGLDRIDPRGDYEIENVNPSCSLCNSIRGEFYTVEEMKEVIGPALRTVRERRQISGFSTSERILPVGASILKRWPEAASQR